MDWFAIDRVPHLKILGRPPVQTKPLPLFYTGSGFEVRTDSPELWITAEAVYDYAMPWVAVELNGARIARFPVPRGTHEICLFQGFAPGQVKRVRVLRETQPMFDDKGHLLTVHALGTAEGTFLPVPEAAHRLTFIGDSLTAAAGSVGAKKEDVWSEIFLSATENYGLITAKLLDADCRLIAQSGWGIVSGWNNDPRTVLHPYYRQVCGLQPGEPAEQAGAQEPFDFAADPCDAVIVNLGTNDASAFREPAWPGDDEHAPFKQHADADGRPMPEDRKRLITQITEDLTMFRACHPEAWIIWGYGMMDDSLYPEFREAVTRYREATGDSKIRMFRFPRCGEDELGSCTHPGAGYHRRAAEALAHELRPLLEKDEEGEPSDGAEDTTP